MLCAAIYRTKVTVMPGVLELESCSFHLPLVSRIDLLSGNVLEASRQFSGRAAVAGHLMPKAEVRCQNNPWARELRGVPREFSPIHPSSFCPSVPPSLAFHTGCSLAAPRP